MKPVRFKGQTGELRPPTPLDQDCDPLPVAVAEDGALISCWRMTWRERIRALVFGRVWVGILRRDTDPSIWLDCRRTVFKKRKRS